MGAEDDESVRRIEIEENIEGGHVDSKDYFFDRIGRPIPILSDQSKSPLFQLQYSPSRPLAVSELHRLIFIAHPLGFYVARTKDVMDAAHESGTSSSSSSSSSIQDLCLVDVPIGKVHILSLSSDSSTLAVSVAADVHFFAVDSLLNKELKPSLSCSLSESNVFVKDIQWRRRSEISFLVLSNHGELYLGALGSPLKSVMDNVDAVEWSLKGKYIAVARENILHILSSKFEERLCISLPFKSWIGDSDDNCSVKVDSIRWVRLDSIVLGCFQQTADGKEENYLIQVIRNKDGKITDASSKPSVLSFYDLFYGLVDDIVPYGSGPYLLLNYLEQCELAIAANRKNADQHIQLLHWSVEDNTSETAIIDIDRDTWLPRIELQGNGDDNLIMGLCVDKVSLYGEVKVEVGLEQKELSPFCVLFSVTLEGKIVMFYVASITGPTIPPEADYILHYEEEDYLSDAPVGNGKFNLKDQTLQQVPLCPQLKDVGKMEVSISKGSEIHINKDVQPVSASENSMTSLTEQISIEDTITKAQEVDSLANFKPYVSDSQEQVLVTKLQPGVDGQLQSLVQKNSSLEGPSLVNLPSKSETQQYTDVRSGSSFSDKVPSNVPSQSKSKDIKRSVDLAKDSPVAFSLTGFQGASIEAWSSGKAILAASERSIFPFTEGQRNKSDATGINIDAGDVLSNVPSQSIVKDVQRSVDLAKDSLVAFNSSDLQGAATESCSSGKAILASSERSSPFPSSVCQRNQCDATGISVDAGDVPVALAGRTFNLRGTTGVSPSTDFSVKTTRILGQESTTKTGTIDSLPSIHCSQLPSQECFALGTSANFRPYSSKDVSKAPSLPNSEPYLSRQFINIKEMAKELGTLLQYIEEPGGFMDACTVSQKSSVESLEEHMQSLSGKCRMWKGIIYEQLGEVQHLLDKTVQVLARKICVDGIIKQASDSRYWELWNRQKLNSEIELKRRHILKLNQVLTSRLIELEGHFNSLELHKFGENSGVHMGWRAFQSKHGSSRQMQSLHTLYKTTDSQLAAAEQLSECLSKQMTVLSIESSVKQNNVKRELFEAIGIPYNTTVSSPDATKVGDSSSLKKLLLSSGSAANKHQSRRHQSSVVKSCDSETARRRRDSLDRSWASFEPSKTTVKRVLLQERQRTTANKSSLMDRQQLGPSVVDSSAVSQPKELTSPSTFMFPSENKGSQYMFPKQAFDKKSTPSKWANDSLRLSQLTSQATELRTPLLQNNNDGSQAMTGKILAKESSNFNVDKTSISVSSNESDSILINETPGIQQSEMSLFKNSPVSMESHAQTPMLKKSTEMLGFNMKTAVHSNSMIETVNHGITSTKGYETSFSLLTAAAPVIPSHSKKVSQFKVAASRSLPSEKESFPQEFSMTLSASSPLIASSASNPSPTAPSLSAAIPFGIPLNNSKDKIDDNRTVSLTSMSSVSSVFSSSSFALEASKLQSPMHTQPPELQPATGAMPPPVIPMHSSSVSEFPKTEAQLPTGNISPSTSPTPPISTSGFPRPGPQPPSQKTSLSADSTSPLMSGPPQTQLRPSVDKLSSRTDVDAAATAPQGQTEPPAFSSKLEPPVSSASTTESSAQLGTTIQSSLNMPSSSLNIANVQPKQPSDGHVLFGAPLASDSSANGKNANLDVAVAEQDEMEEEAPETSRTNDISLGSLGGLGFGSTPSSTAPRANPFGGSFGNIGTNQASSFTTTPPSSGLFRPASFSFQSPPPSQSSPPMNLGAFSGGFGTAAIVQDRTQGGFGQPSQIGAGQQALGSVLGSFGQSRHFGAGLPVGIASTSSMGGFSSAATGGGFVAVASTGGGFAGLASGGGGFAGTGSGAGGFSGMTSAGGGLGAAAPSSGGFAGAAGGGFGAFSSQQGAGGFSAFSGNTVGNQGIGGFSAFSINAGGTGKPPELFTQMRK